MEILRFLRFIGTGVMLSLVIPTQSFAEGNRYDFDRKYKSEISAVEAHKQQYRWRTVLIDVRRLREHASGHPKRAFNVPYPHIVNKGDQLPENLYWEVYRIVKGRVHSPVMTLCRTGARSVLAGNILADPAAYGIEGPAFTNVRNIWEGFVGRYKEPYVSPIQEDEDPAEHEAKDHQYLDLNNNGVLDDDVADVYSHTTDANPDKDGWRNFLGLSWNTKISRRTAYMRDTSLYLPYTEPVVPE